MLNATTVILALGVIPPGYRLITNRVMPVAPEPYQFGPDEWGYSHTFSASIGTETHAVNSYGKVVNWRKYTA